CRRFTDDFGVGFQVALRRVLAFLLLRMGKGTLGYGNGIVYIKGFWQVFKSATLVGGDRTVQVGMGGHDNDRNLRMGTMQIAEQGESVGARHTDIADDGIRRIAV